MNGKTALWVPGTYRFPLGPSEIYAKKVYLQVPRVSFRYPECLQVPGTQSASRYPEYLQVPGTQSAVFPFIYIGTQGAALYY